MDVAEMYRSNKEKMLRNMLQVACDDLLVRINALNK